MHRHDRIPSLRRSCLNNMRVSGDPRVVDDECSSPRRPSAVSTSSSAGGPLADITRDGDRPWTPRPWDLVDERRICRVPPAMSLTTTVRGPLVQARWPRRGPRPAGRAGYHRDQSGQISHVLLVMAAPRGARDSKSIMNTL